MKTIQSHGITLNEPVKHSFSQFGDLQATHMWQGLSDSLAGSGIVETIYISKCSGHSCNCYQTSPRATLSMLSWGFCWNYILSACYLKTQFMFDWDQPASGYWSACWDSFTCSIMNKPLLVWWVNQTNLFSTQLILLIESKILVSHHILIPQVPSSCDANKQNGGHYMYHSLPNLWQIFNSLNAFNW